MRNILVCLAGLLLLGLPLQAADSKLQILEQKVDNLVKAWANMNKTESAPASAEKVSFHGYGELHYSNTNKSGATNLMDMHRLALGWSTKPLNWLKLSAEIDFEHAGSVVELEFAQADILFTDGFNLRIGTLLMPVGNLNENHEPVNYYSVERPYVQKLIIPTTWQEGGVGVYGSPADWFNYKAYIVGGLDASSFTAANGIRSGRGRAAEAKGSNLASVGRVDFSFEDHFQFGFSAYSGGAAQGNANLGDAGVTIIESDLRLTLLDLIEFSGMFASLNLSGSDRISTVTAQTVGKNQIGWLVEGAYHLGKQILPENQDLVIMTRLEKLNTQQEVVSALTASKSNDRQITTIGIAYLPAPQVALKLDLENWSDQAGGSWQQWNTGLAYVF